MGQNDKLRLFENKRIRTAWDEEKKAEAQNRLIKR